MYREGLLGRGELDKVKYTSSLADDSEIFRETVISLIAHVNELERLGILGKPDADSIRSALRDIVKGGYRPMEGYEDVHEYVEAELIRRIGQIGGWVGLGRSRNDHVATAIRLRLRRRILELVMKALELRTTLLDKAIETSESLIVGSTHRQPAQATTLGHYMLYLDELTGDFVDALMGIYGIINKSPLGSGPLAGTMVKLDRFREAVELGFNGIVENTIYATGSRFFAILPASIVVSYLVELGRFINTVEMWLMPQLNYVEIPASHLATSSIMPHKRNPATLEVFRARIGEAVGHLVALYSIERPVESGYQLDLQEATRHLWAILSIAVDGLGILKDAVAGVRVNVDRVREDLARFNVTAAEYAEEQSMTTKTPFRAVHAKVASMIREGKPVGVDVREVVYGKAIVGGPNPQNVVELAKSRLTMVKKSMELVRGMIENIDKAEGNLLGG